MIVLVVPMYILFRSWILYTFPTIIIDEFLELCRWALDIWIIITLLIIISIFQPKVATKLKQPIEYNFCFKFIHSFDLRSLNQCWVSQRNILKQSFGLDYTI